MGLDTCQQFIQPPVAVNSTGLWRNLYAGSSEHVTGPLLGAIHTTDNLGTIKVSCQILDEAPVLPNGQKVLPRYFHIETQFQPINPLTLRLFFTAADLEAYNLTPPFTSTIPFDLGLTHYDGDNEDCDPTNNSLTAGLAVSPSNVILFESDSIFYLEAVFDDFSEFGAAVPFTVNTTDITESQFLVMVYPNPSEGLFRIRLLNKFIGDNFEYMLMDVLGRPVRSGQLFQDQGSLETELDFSTLTSGMYQLLVYQRGVILSRNKLLKM